jgi:hypothetical protein
MTQQVTRQIVGYDPATEAVAVEIDIPSEQWRSVTSLIPRNAEDPDYVFNYALDIGVANDILGMIGHRGAQNLNYFLECARD